MTVGEQLRELREYIGAVERDGKETARGTRAAADELGKLRAFCEHVAVQVQRLGVDRSEHPPAIWWPDLHARDADLAERKRVELETWVGDVLGVFGPVAREVTDCWDIHEDAVAYLTAAWIAWLGAYRDPNAVATASADWLRVSLPTLGIQLQATLAACKTKGQHVRPGEEDD